LFQQQTLLMTGSLLWWALLAMLLFWAVGVYNRLMRIRARGLDALGSVEKNLKLYGTIVHAHLAGMGVAEVLAPPAPDKVDSLPVAWRALVNAIAELDVSTKRARAAPMTAAPMAAMASHWKGVQQAWDTLQQQPADLAGPQVPDTVQSEWDDVTAKANIARGGYNQIATRYNEAMGQFPARLVAGFLGFQPAGML
jgi:LemA protein